MSDVISFQMAPGILLSKPRACIFKEMIEGDTQIMHIRYEYLVIIS